MQKYAGNILILILMISLTGLSVSTTVAQQRTNSEEIIILQLDTPDITYDGENLLLNATMNITSGLTIRYQNSVIDFQANASNGIIIFDGNLQLINTTVRNGGKCISSGITGSLYLANSTVEKCLGDSIELKGNYDFTMTNSVVTNGSGHGIQLQNLPNRANISDSIISNFPFGDAINADNTNLDFVNVTIELIGDEGISLDIGGEISISQSKINTTFGDAVKIENTLAPVTIDQLMIFSAGDDGIYINETGKVSLSDIMIDKTLGGDAIKIEFVNDPISISSTHIVNSGDEAIQINDGSGSITLFDLSLKNSAGKGLQISDASSLTVESAIISGNENVGIDIKDINTFIGEVLEVTGNTDYAFEATSVSTFMVNTTKIEGPFGFFLEDVNSSDIHWNDFSGITGTVINATLVGLDRSVNATLNYWGTLDSGNFKYTGNVIVEPFLTSEFILYVPDNEIVNGEQGGFLQFNILFGLTGLVLFAITVRRKT